MTAVVGIISISNLISASSIVLHAGLKLGRVNRVTFCLDQVGLTRFIRYPGLTQILYIVSHASMMSSGPDDDGIVCPNSAQDASMYP